MLQLSRILFPVDFSGRCSAAAPQVAALARHFDAQLTLLNVMQIPTPWYGNLAPAELEMLIDVEKLEKQNRSALNSYLEDEIHGVRKVTHVVEKGDPASVIVEYARSHRMDLIMMPTHGNGAFRRFLLGSVTAKVLHDAESPVWTDIHAKESFTPAGCKSVTCAVDLRPESASTIEWAAELAASYDAEFRIVHAIPAIAGPIHPSVAHLCGFMIQSARDYIDDLQRKAGTTAKVCIEGGNIAEVVRECAVQHGSSLVVVGPDRTARTLGGLRSNAYAIIRESACPVIRA